MTTATNTALGEIQLAGDLAGNNNGLAPALTTVLGTPGSFPVPSLTVDAKGRVTAIATTAPSVLAALIPDASYTSKGVVRIGDNILINSTAVSGYQIIDFGGALTNSTPTGLCSNGATYSFSVLRDGVGPLAVSATASSLTLVSDLLSVVNAQIAPFVLSIDSGNLRLSSNTTGVTSSVLISLDKLFQYMANYVALNSPVAGMGDATIYVPEATSSVKGVARFGSGFSVSGGTVTLDTIQDATTSQKGVVQVGSGLSVSGGVLSLTPIPDSSTTVKGLVQVGSGLAVSGGVISVPDATASVKGVLSVGNNLSISSGVLSVATASTGARGVVRIGAGINVTVDGIISVPFATTGALGVVQVGAGLTVNGSGVVSADPIPDATTATKGVVQIGSGLSVSGGVVSATPVPDATTTTKGIVQIGSGLSVSGGVVSADPIPDATTTTKGIVQIGANLSVSGGVLSASYPDATNSTPGLVTIGSGLSVSAGVVSADIPDATTSSKGLVQVGSGLSVSSGVISATLATNTEAGIVRSANSLNISISSGLIDVGVNIPKKNTVNTFTKAQVVALVSPTFSASVTPDFSAGNVFFYTATSNFTLNAPINVVPGGTYIIIIQQDATGGRVCTFNSAYKFPAISSALSTTANKTDIVSIVAQSPGLLLSTMQIGF